MRMPDYGQVHVAGGSTTFRLDHFQVFLILYFHYSRVAYFL